MTRSRLIALAAAVILAGLAAAQDWAEMSPAEQQKMMQEWVRLGTPAEPHQALEPLVGTWKTTSRLWMAGPDAPPMESHGTSVKTWVLGGRWLQEDLESEMMGQPLQGRGMTGFDNFKNTYVIESRDRHVFTMYDLHAGDDYKAFEIVYERAE
jgi:hypothetical protein